MDIKLEKDILRWRFIALSSTGQEWLKEHFDSTNALLAPARRGKNVARMMEDDGLLLGGDAGIGGDYVDFLAELHVLRRAREGGDTHMALVRLVALRDEVVDAVPREPRCRALLPDIDREIGLAHSECVAPVRGPASAAARGTLARMARLWRFFGSFEKLLLRAAVSVLLAVDVARLLLGQF